MDDDSERKLDIQCMCLADEIGPADETGQEKRKEREKVKLFFFATF